MRKHLVFNNERSLEVCQALLRAWQKRESWLKNIKPPERHHFPAELEYGSREHGLYLFFTGFCNRSGSTAEQVISRASIIARDELWMIDPNHYKDGPYSRFEEMITGAIPLAIRYPERLQWWEKTLELLKDNFDSDPRNIFLSFDTDLVLSDPMEARRILIDHTFGQFKGRGIAHKIAQLIIQWFQDVDWPENKSKWNIIRVIPVVAVDIWIARLVHQFGLIEGWKSDHRDRIGREISDYLAELCFDNHLPWSDLTQSFWHCGSVICGRMRRHRSPMKASTYCVTACPMQPFCQFIVKGDKILRSRGQVGWDEPINHYPNLFNQNGH